MILWLLVKELWQNQITTSGHIGFCHYGDPSEPRLWRHQKMNLVCSGLHRYLTAHRRREASRPYHTTKGCTQAAQPVLPSIWIGRLCLIHRESLEGRQKCSEGDEPHCAGPSPQKETPVDQRRDPRNHWWAPHSPPMWQQCPGTTSCYQTQTTTTTWWDCLVQPHSRRGRRRESHWKQFSALPYHPHTHGSDCIQATTCDCQRRNTTLRWNRTTPQMEIPFPRTVQQSCPTTRSSPHGRSCQCYSRPLNRFYPTNSRRNISCNPKTEDKPSPRNLRHNSWASEVWWSSNHQLATSSFHTHLEILCHPHWLEHRHNSSTLERKRPEVRLHEIPRHITSLCSGQGFRPHMSRTYKKDNLCEATTTTERLYPWPIHTWLHHRTQTPSWATTWIPPTTLRRLHRPQSCIWLSGPQLPLEHSKNYWYTPKLVDIIKTLYSSTRSVVRVNGTISEAFSISSGVRQGCVLAANLFNTATDRILNNSTQAQTLGVNYDDSGQLITDLDYADDVVIFADLFDTLREALFIFNEQSKKLGLHVNWSKTKLQSFSPWIPTPPSTLIGTQPVTTTDNFTYLGSTTASSNSSFNDVNRRIAIATSTMATLSSIWTSSRLSLALKMRSTTHS